MTSNLKEQRKLRQDRKKIGQCIYCKNKARDNRVTCESCGEKNAKSSRGWRKKLRLVADEFNICNLCNSKQRVKNKKLCEFCLTVKRLDDKIRASKKRQERRLANLCIRCGGNDKDHDAAICYNCKKSMKDRKDANKENRKNRLRCKKRELNHLCKRCGNKLKNLNFKNCLECRKKRAIHSSNAYNKKKDKLNASSAA